MAAATDSVCVWQTHSWLANLQVWYLQGSTYINAAAVVKSSNNAAEQQAETPNPCVQGCLPLCTLAAVHRALRRYAANPTATGPLCTTMAAATDRLTAGSLARLAAPTARPSDAACCIRAMGWQMKECCELTQLLWSQAEQASGLGWPHQQPDHQTLRRSDARMQSSVVTKRRAE
jgi:hypothetical protein